MASLWAGEPHNNNRSAATSQTCITFVREMDDASDPRLQAAEAYAFRALVAHLKMRTDVQNIDVMNLTGFCRNCLSKWLHAGAAHTGVPITYDAACERVYGMPYSEFKQTHQAKATPEQLARFEETKALHAKHRALPTTPTAAEPPARLLSDVCCEPVVCPLGQTPAFIPPPPPTVPGACRAPIA